MGRSVLIGERGIGSIERISKTTGRFCSYCGSIEGTNELMTVERDDERTANRNSEGDLLTDNERDDEFMTTR